MIRIYEKALSACGLFAGINPAERDRLLVCLHGERRRYGKNEILWHIGDPVNACALIISGSVRAESVNAAGAHSLMAIHRAGSLVGDVLMATPGGASPVYVLAEEPTDVLFLPYETIMGGCRSCCPSHTLLRKNLLAEIARKFWAQRRRIACLSENALRTRIAMYLLEQAGEGSTVTFSGTREDLADYLCVNRSALSRELSRMKQDGLIDFQRGKFSILAREAMEHCVP